jgi:hypothetical protein
MVPQFKLGAHYDMMDDGLSSFRRNSDSDDDDLEPFNNPELDRFEL